MHIKDLSSIPLIFIPEDKRISILFRQVFLKNGAVFEPSLIVSNVREQMLAVEKGLGYSFVQLGSALSDIQAGKLIYLDVDYVDPCPYVLYMATLKNNCKDPIVQSFLEIILDEANKAATRLASFGNSTVVNK